METNMKKKFFFGGIAGLLAVALLLCMPFSQIDLASGTVRMNPILPDALAPDEPSIITDGQYSLTLESSIGILTYYNQSDTRWAEYLYGGQDPLKKYGCGPTVLAMIVSSFTNQTLLPPEMADWAAAIITGLPEEEPHITSFQSAPPSAFRLIPFKILQWKESCPSCLAAIS